MPDSQPVAGTPNAAPALDQPVCAFAPRTLANIIKASVVPRPIAWVSTMSPDRVLNLAPHSYFTILAESPPTLGFVSSGWKDTIRNIETSGEYVINIFGEELLTPMNLTAADFPPEEDEFAWSGMTPEPSTEVRVPRVAEAPIAFELRLLEIRSYGDETHPSFLIAGRIVHVRIHERVLNGHHVEPGLLRAVGRLGGAAIYTRTTDRFDLARPTYADLLKSRNGMER